MRAKVLAPKLHSAANLGKDAALRTGCEGALGLGAEVIVAEVIVAMDADGQHRAEDLPRLLGPLLAGETDVVLTYREPPGRSMPAVLKRGNAGLSSIVRMLFGVAVRDSQCGLRAFTAAAYPGLRWEARDNSLRLRSRGWTLHVVPTAEVIHHYHFSRNPTRWYFLERNWHWVWLAHLKGSTLAAEAAVWAVAIRGGWARLKLRSYAYWTASEKCALLGAGTESCWPRPGATCSPRMSAARCSSGLSTPSARPPGAASTHCSAGEPAYGAGLPGWSGWPLSWLGSCTDRGQRRRRPRIDLTLATTRRFKGFLQYNRELVGIIGSRVKQALN